MTEPQRIPIGFDIETSGFSDDAVITVVGFDHCFGNSLILNTGGRENFHWGMLLNTLDDHSNDALQLDVVTTERELLELVASYVKRQTNGDRDYVAAFNDETWKGGFAPQFCRRRFLQHDIPWPFGDLAFGDMRQIPDCFNTTGRSDLVGAYEAMVGHETCDPFEESEDAIMAFESAAWLPLLKHNLADIQRTRELAQLAGSLVPKSNCSMENLQPAYRE